MGLNTSHPSMIHRIVLATAVYGMYLAGAIYAIFPKTDAGKLSLQVLMTIGGVGLLAFFISCVLHLSEQVARSVQHWKSEIHEPGQPFLLGSECVVIFGGWVEATGAVAIMFVLCGFLITIVALLAFVVSFGTLGFIPTFRGDL